MMDDSLALDSFVNPPGTWRGRLQPPARRFAQQSFDIVATPLAPAARASIAEWLGQRSPISAPISAKTTPVDLLEIGNALRFAACITCMVGVYAAGLRLARTVDQDFESSGMREHACLTRLVSAVLEDTRLIPFKMECQQIFDLEGFNDVASFIAAYDFEDNSQHQSDYVDITDAAERVLINNDQMIEGPDE